MAELGFGFTTIIIVVVVIYLLSSIKILAEYERGVIFRLGRLLPEAKGPGSHSGIRADRPHRARVAAAGSVRGTAAGHHHARQRHAEGERRHLSARDRAAARRWWKFRITSTRPRSLRRLLCARSSASRSWMSCWRTATRSICGCRAFSITHT